MLLLFYFYVNCGGGGIFFKFLLGFIVCDIFCGFLLVYTASNYVKISIKNNIHKCTNALTESLMM